MSRARIELWVALWVVYLVWGAKGLIDNGGFRYLLEKNLAGDPHFALTAAAFQAIGCGEAHAAFQQVLALFPEGKLPRSVDRRLRQYRKAAGGMVSDMDRQFWGAREAVPRCLASYILAHKDRLAHLLT